MASRTRLLFATIVAVLFIVSATAREVPAARLDGGGGGLMECWNALFELKSCTNEIILFFLNGETKLGPQCCQAVDVITTNCWPAMLTSLGFTAEEATVLRGYCQNPPSGDSSPSPSPQDV